jgi:hypothetical protein
VPLYYRGVVDTHMDEGKNKDGELEQDKRKGKKKPGKPLFVKGPALDSRPVVPIGVIDKQVLNDGDTHLAPKEGDGNKKTKSKTGLREMVTVKRKPTETETSTFMGRDSDTQHVVLPGPALKRKAVVPAISDSDNESAAPKSVVSHSHDSEVPSLVKLILAFTSCAQTCQTEQSRASQRVRHISLICQLPSDNTFRSCLNDILHHRSWDS